MRVGSVDRFALFALLSLPLGLGLRLMKPNLIIRFCALPRPTAPSLAKAQACRRRHDGLEPRRDAANHRGAGGDVGEALLPWQVSIVKACKKR